jgi:hypothetical protein
MPHVQSLYDEIYTPAQIRRDQRKRIADLVKANQAHPQVALSLVKDYCKGNAKVGFIRFDNPNNPQSIIVFTEGSTYYYRLSDTKRIEAPTL